MTIRNTMAAALALTLGAAAALAARHEAQATYTFSGTADGVVKVVVEAPEAAVEATSWERGEIRVRALKTVAAPESAKAGRVRRAVDNIEIEVGRRGDEVAVEVSYPRACDQDLNCSVSFQLHAPAAVEVEARGQTE